MKYNRLRKVKNKNMDIIGRIEKLCQQRGWSIYELSKKSGISSNAIYKWRNQNVQPSIPNLEAICEAFGLSLKEFFCGIGTSNLSPEQNQLLEDWSILTPKEKSILKELI